LWEDSSAPALPASALVEISVAGDQTAVALDDRLLLAVSDGDLSAGRIGLYAWRAKVHFDQVIVETIGSPVILWAPTLMGLSELTVIDEAGTLDRPSNWAAAAGVVTETSTIHDDDGNAPRKAGTLVV